MTRKDYNLIAVVIKKNYSPEDPETEPFIKRLAYDMAAALKKTNPQFDEDKFLASCGIEDINR